MLVSPLECFSHKITYSKTRWKCLILVFLIGGWRLFACGLERPFLTTRMIEHNGIIFSVSIFRKQKQQINNRRSKLKQPFKSSSLVTSQPTGPHILDSWCTNIICRKWQLISATSRNILLLSISVISNFTATTISSRTCAEQEQQSRRKASIHTTATTANYFSNAKQNNKRTTNSNSKDALIPRHNNFNNNHDNISSSTFTKQQQQKQQQEQQL